MAIESREECPKCGGGHKSKPFAIYPTAHHCFSCGYHKVLNRQYNPKSDYIPFFKVKVPPLKSYPHLSSEVSQYLIERNVTLKQIDRYSIKEAPGPSLFLPIVVPGEGIVRYVRKWIDGSRTHSEGGDEYSLLINNHDQDRIVIVEDYISCIRVGELANCYCLFGTNITDKMVKFLCDRYSNIVIWLDNDTGRPDGRNPGQEGARRVITKFKRRDSYLSRKHSFNYRPIEINNIITEKDPKYYTDEQINEILN